MAARAIWKAVIRFGDVSLPVKLYSAVREQGVRFHLLHDQDMVRVKQRLANARTGRTVEYEDAVKGYEVDSGTFVILRKDELDALAPESSRDIAISHFVPSQCIHPQWYDRPYFLGPDGEDGNYFALARALAKQEKEGIAHWTMRKKDYVGTLRSQDNYLVLITMHHQGDIVTAEELEPPTGRKLDLKERRMAEQLINALEDEFDPSDYHDGYRERVLKLIAAKRKGKTFEIEEEKIETRRGSLREVLAASLEQVTK